MPDIISTRTMLIEEVPPSPEFLRFEREPRTFFYLAGGIIRELRKALEKKQVRVPAPKMTWGRRLEGRPVTKIESNGNI